jgi:hypothetical protein
VRSPSTEGSHEPSDAKTPSPMLSGSPSPPGSLSEVASCRPHSPVFEQSGPSEKAPVIDLSSSSDGKILLLSLLVILSSPSGCMANSTVVS